MRSVPNRYKRDKSREEFEGQFVGRQRVAVAEIGSQSGNPEKGSAVGSRYQAKASEDCD